MSTSEVSGFVCNSESQVQLAALSTRLVVQKSIPVEMLPTLQFYPSVAIVFRVSCCYCCDCLLPSEQRNIQRTFVHLNMYHRPVVEPGYARRSSHIFISRKRSKRKGRSYNLPDVAFCFFLAKTVEYPRSSRPLKKS